MERKYVWVVTCWNDRQEHIIAVYDTPDAAHKTANKHKDANVLTVYAFPINTVVAELAGKKLEDRMGSLGHDHYCYCDDDYGGN